MISPSRISTATITARRVPRSAVFARAPDHIHLVRDGRLVHPADVKNVAQIHRRAPFVQAHHGVEHVLLGLVFAGELQGEIASLGAHRAAGNHRVAGGNRVFHHLRRQAVAGQIGIREEQVHHFLHDGDFGDFADAGDLFESHPQNPAQATRAGAVAVARRGRGANLGERVFVSHQQDRTSEIGV